MTGCARAVLGGILFLGLIAYGIITGRKPRHR